MPWRRLGEPFRGLGRAIGAPRGSIAPNSPPTATMGWTAWWNPMITTGSYTDAGVTLIANDNDLIYRLGEQLGVVANSYFQQTVAASRPLYKTGGTSGQTYAYFDSSDDFMESLAISNFFTNAAKTILLAMTVRTGWANGLGVFSDSSGYVVLNVQTGNVLRLVNYGGAGAGNNNSFTDDVTLIYVGKHDTGKLYSAVNGVTWNTGVNTSVTDLLTGLLYIGRRAATYSPINLYSLAVANTVISDANLAMTVNYFKNQLGISA